MVTAQATAPLTTAQLGFFEREGYLKIEGVLDDATLSAVADDITREIDRRAWPLFESGELSSLYADQPFERRLACISRETDQVALAIWNGVLATPAIFELLRHPRLLDIAEQLCGPELIASSVYRLRPKLPGYHYGAVPWHQDSGYFEPYCDNALVLTVWLPLVDATPENGCLWVLPGAHRGPVVPHRRHATTPYLEIAPEHLPPGQAVCVPVRRGGILLLSNRIPHASYENRSDAVRWSMDLRYQSAALPTNAGITRLPEEAQAGRDPQAPLACYPPEADFLIRSQARPEEVIVDPDDFRRLRTRYRAQPVTNRWNL